MKVALGSSFIMDVKNHIPVADVTQEKVFALRNDRFRQIRSQDEPGFNGPRALAEPKQASDDVRRQRCSPSISFAAVGAFRPPNLTTHARPSQVLSLLRLSPVHGGVNAGDNRVKRLR